MTFSMPSLALILGRLTVKNCASKLAPCLVKLFCLCLSTSTYPSCWKFAVLCTGSGNMQDFFFYLFLFVIVQYFFNVKNISMLKDTMFFVSTYQGVRAVCGAALSTGLLLVVEGGKVREEGSPGDGLVLIVCVCAGHGRVHHPHSDREGVGVSGG